MSAVIDSLADSKRDIMGSWPTAGRTDQSITLQATIDDVVHIAWQTDVIIAAVREAQGVAGEASSRSNITVLKTQHRLPRAFKPTRKRLVIVPLNGRPLSLVLENQQADALLQAWFPGIEGGNAIVDVLFGDHNSSSKLPMLFPHSVGQAPIYYNCMPTGRPSDPQKPEKYTSYYYFETNGLLFLFSYGLSYTHFTLSLMTLSAAQLAPVGSLITATVTLTNDNDREDTTMVQLYLHDVTASISRLVTTLQGFHKVFLKARA